MRLAAFPMVPETYRLDKSGHSGTVPHGPCAVRRAPCAVRRVSISLRRAPRIDYRAPWFKDPRPRLGCQKPQKSAKNHDSRPMGGSGGGFGLVS